MGPVIIEQCVDTNNPVRVLGIVVDPTKVENQRIRSALQRLTLSSRAGYTKHAEYTKHSRYAACPLMIPM